MTEHTDLYQLIQKLIEANSLRFYSVFAVVLLICLHFNGQLSG